MGYSSCWWLKTIAYSAYQTVIENLLNVSNDTIGYHLQEFYRGCGVCCSNWLSWEPAVRGRVGAVSSFSTRGSAPAFILPSLTLPGLLWLDSRGIRDRLFCPTDNLMHYLFLGTPSQPGLDFFFQSSTAVWPFNYPVLFPLPFSFPRVRSASWSEDSPHLCWLLLLLSFSWAFLLRNLQHD